MVVCCGMKELFFIDVMFEDVRKLRVVLFILLLFFEEVIFGFL